MEEIDQSKVIEVEPLLYVGGVLCKSKRDVFFYKTLGLIATICGIIGIFGLIMLLSIKFI